MGVTALVNHCFLDQQAAKGDVVEVIYQAKLLQDFGEGSSEKATVVKDGFSGM